jgi:hypothetical protein
LGAVAVRIHTPEFRGLQKDRVLTDVDLMSYSKYENAIKSFLVGRGLKPLEFYYGEGRQIYENHYHIDVFFNELSMNHVIDLRGRLELDYPTITVTDLLLGKLQIVQINEKDLKDSAILLREHDISEQEGKELVDSRHISRRMAKDWGFYYTFTQNLKRLDSFSATYLPTGDYQVVSGRIKDLLNRIESEPKSTGWKIRAGVGLRRKWYQDVEEVIR